jgi:hypothetical protein
MQNQYLFGTLPVIESQAVTEFSYSVLPILETDSKILIQSPRKTRKWAVIWSPPGTNCYEPQNVQNEAGPANIHQVLTY